MGPAPLRPPNAQLDHHIMLLRMALESAEALRSLYMALESAEALRRGG